MGKLVKNHLARLVTLIAAVCKFIYTIQIVGALHAMIWPKMFWSFINKELDSAVKPMPFVQILNLFSGILALIWEWPIWHILDTKLHNSIKARIYYLPIPVVAALLLYQTFDVAIYYLIGFCLYIWAYTEGEISRF
ncbi:hypothetical protein B0J14DRAFT_568448 [Halenospora varia]|nr:hypothetical protein B0J14DRAFT_568448 [Halenospora varia]